jgi:peroxiredoxin family protein/TusA-related sulfurtransferase/rhodanese-related sulfurtransferase
LEKDRPKQAVVIGGGYIGLEMAEALHHRGLAVTVVEMAKQVMGHVDPEIASVVQQRLAHKGIVLKLGQSVTGFADQPDHLNVIISSGESIPCGIALIAVGVKPDIRLAKEAGLKIGERGGIVVNAHMQTSDPSIYAVGDAVEVEDFVGGFPTLVPLAGPANRQGRIAAEHIFGRDSAYLGTQGTSICKIFDLTLASTGLNEKTLRRLGKPYEKIYLHPADHASYYPNAHPMTLKLLFDKTSGLILGAQTVGMSGVDKRIDVLAVAIRAKLSVMDLEHLELAYAPPYGSAKDPINYAGFVASHVVRGDLALAYMEDILNLKPNQKILDVRTVSEVHTGTIPGSMNIPLDDLRERLGDLNKQTEYLVTCQVGMRAYLACRILSQLGFACRLITGGFTTYKAATAFEHGAPAPAIGRVIHADSGEDESRAIPAADIAPAETVDARSLSCPGPIQRLAEAMQRVRPREVVKILVTDPGFATDIPAWCQSTGHTLLHLELKDRTYEALVQKHVGAAGGPSRATVDKAKTIIVFSSDFDRVMAAFIIANGAAAMNSKVTLFFTFWGLSLLRKTKSPLVKKSLLEGMFSWMLPRGVGRLPLSKMNFGGVSPLLMQQMMKNKHVASLPELVAMAQKSGVRLVACSMTMEIMGIKREELIEGVEEGGVAMYLNAAETADTNLFI